MIKKYIVPFTCDERDVNNIREFAQQYFHQLGLLCRTYRTCPEQGWNTPAFGAPIEVWAVVSPKGQQSQSKGLLRICRDFQKQVLDRFEHARSSSIESQWC